MSVPTTDSPFVGGALKTQIPNPDGNAGTDLHEFAERRRHSITHRDDLYSTESLRIDVVARPMSVKPEIKDGRFSALWLTAWLQMFASLLALPAQPQPGTVLWTYDASRPIVSAPAIGPDGTIYVGTYESLHAITNAGGFGSNYWIFPVYVVNGTALGPDGTVYLVPYGKNAG